MTGTRQTGARGLEALVDEYSDLYRRDRERELRYFQIARTDEDAISAAALARLPNGKKHPHLLAQSSVKGVTERVSSARQTRLPAPIKIGAWRSSRSTAFGVNPPRRPSELSARCGVPRPSRSRATPSG